MSKSVKLHFEANLAYQKEAIDAVCDLFRGQDNSMQSSFTVAYSSQIKSLELTGTGNCLQLLESEILSNLHEVQERNGLVRSESIQQNELDFTVEMETGTGKTYVYLRSIFELNKLYGFKKFVIVVPSIAIKEGVFKTIELTKAHFHSLYDGVVINPFLYDSSNLENVRSFASSSQIEIMVCTIQSITNIVVTENFSDTAKKKGKKAKRIMHEPNEKTGGLKPISFIRQCKPIVIIDEPQNIGKKGEENGIRTLDPLCTLRYSATHKDLRHPVYCLNAIDASEQKLVKSIEVEDAALSIKQVSPYIKLIGTKEHKKRSRAKLELFCRKDSGEYTIELFDLEVGDVLSLQTGLDIYGTASISYIERDYVEISTLNKPLHLREAVGIDFQNDLLRAMIRATIEKHLKNEIRLRPMGIKVLSLFFLDRVADYSSNGHDRDGVCARIFEEEYSRLIKRSDYVSLFGKSIPEATAVHNGYFSISKASAKAKGGWADTVESNDTGRAAASKAYELIMKDKERLLSLDEPLKFIFSHSALKEGWDNPNVFQVCVLRDMKNSLTRRQAIGRGLRICVNQEGERVRHSGINHLTVIAREEFSKFAKALQREYEESGLEFGKVSPEKLGAVRYTDAAGEQLRLGQDKATELMQYLIVQGYIDKKNKATDLLREELKNNTFHLPDEYAEAQAVIKNCLSQLAKTLEIKNAKEAQTIRTRKRVLNSPQFEELWKRISRKTTYRVSFDSDELIRNIVPPLDKELEQIKAPLITLTTTQAQVSAGGVVADGKSRKRIMGAVSTDDTPVPDLLTELQERTRLTRRTLASILCKLKHLGSVKVNPSAFLNICQKVINKQLRSIMVSGVSYKPITIGETYWAQELLDREVSSYASDVIKTAEKDKSLTDYIVCDSAIERNFVEDADASPHVKCYVKLPNWFKIPTPLGDYNPDWALVYEEDGVEQLYFVVETKGVNLLNELDDHKQADKILCGRQHFNNCLAKQPDTLAPAALYVAPVASLCDFQAKLDRDSISAQRVKPTLSIPRPDASFKFSVSDFVLQYLYDAAASGCSLENIFSSYQKIWSRDNIKHILSKKCLDNLALLDEPKESLATVLVKLISNGFIIFKDNRLTILEGGKIAIHRISNFIKELNKVLYSISEPDTILLKESLRENEEFIDLKKSLKAA